MIYHKSKHEYVVKLKNKKPITNDELHEILRWATSNFGEKGRDKKCIWRYGWISNKNVDTFYFKYEKDAFFFCMRWL